MTIQFSQIDASQSNLFQDSHAQPNADSSFEEKLKFEKSRLNLFFSPFAQLQSFFASQLNLNLKPPSESQGLSFYSRLDQSESKPNNPGATFRQTYPANASGPKIFDSSSFPTPNRQIVQALLEKTDWLIPNLEAQPFFNQVFMQGKLQPSFDLQSLVDQILEQISLVKSKNKTELSLALKPENMGEIILTLVSHSGTVSIQIQASSETKKLIDSRRQELEMALKKAKVNFDTIQISEVEKYAV